MTTIVARAPGKLFLLGEYAVLDGAPALVAAVDRYLEARLTPRPEARVRIHAAGHGEPIAFPAGARPEHPPLRFVLAAYGEVIAAHPHLATRGFDLELVSSLDAPADGTKLGLGGSAAATVAVTAALLAASGLADEPSRLREAVFATASRAHRAAQGDTGSGADVAASTFGSIVELMPAAGDALPRHAVLSLPRSATLLAAWTGAAAETGSLVRRYGALPAQRREPFVAVCRDSAAALATALRQGAVSGAAIDAAGDALIRLGDDAALPIVTPPLRRLVTIARAHGAAAKSSGAGGGDCGIALTTDPTAVGHIRAAWRAAGLTPLDLAFGAPGVTVAAA